ncbi:MAG: hypothetical protein WAK95_06865 [Desulfobacterales bacterium]
MKYMAITAHKKLPTVEQVEAIIDDWGTLSIEEFAARFELDIEVIEAIVASLRRLQRISDPDGIPAVACYRNDALESIVRCAGARRGFV